MRRRHRGSAERGVPSGVIGRENVYSGGGDIHRRAPVRERRSIVRRVRGRNGERVCTTREIRPGARSGIACRDHDHRSVVPRVVHRVLKGLRARGLCPEAQIDHLGAVVSSPSDSIDDRRGGPCAVIAEHLSVEDAGIVSDPSHTDRVVRDRRSCAGDVRAVVAEVVDVRRGREVGLQHDLRSDVDVSVPVGTWIRRRTAVDAAVEYGDLHRAQRMSDVPRFGGSDLRHNRLSRSRRAPHTQPHRERDTPRPHASPCLAGRRCGTSGTVATRVRRPPEPPGWPRPTLQGRRPAGSARSHFPGARDAHRSRSDREQCAGRCDHRA